VTPGARIMVVEGSARGDVGVVLGPSKYTFGDEAVLRVQLDGAIHESHLRASILVPEPERSDEDVCGPLRNNVSG
jgi:hypothetical protein